jgi:hypothetical protein
MIINDEHADGFWTRHTVRAPTGGSLICAHAELLLWRSGSALRGLLIRL